MIEQPGVLLTFIAFVAVIGPLVFIHEMGHYLAARWAGIKADEFAIGFGREVAGWTDRRGTRWKLGWLPLGGYVRFAGDMNPASIPTPEWLSLPAEERARTFQAAPLHKRAIVVAAGPAMNFLLAFLILAGFAMAFGVSRTPAVVGNVSPGSAAAAAGLVPGDRIVALGGRQVDTFDDMVRYIKIRPNAAITVSVEREGRRVEVPATIGVQTIRDRFGNTYQTGLLGVAPARPQVEPVGPLAAMGVAVERIRQIIVMMIETLGQIIMGLRSVSELGGPLSIAKVAGEQMTLGLPDFVFLLALVSINLGFINLLPVPVLDGGHLLFYAIEAVRRRPLAPSAQEWAFRGGLAAILALMLLVTFNDLGAFGLWRGLAGLIG